MIGILAAEGFTVTERELMRLRAKNRLLLRGANILKSTLKPTTSEHVQTMPDMHMGGDSSTQPHITPMAESMGDVQNAESPDGEQTSGLLSPYSS